jgi:hypothetical protein
MPYSVWDLAVIIALVENMVAVYLALVLLSEILICLEILF